mgnify:FL=1|jgi:hypothetical protein
MNEKDKDIQDRYRRSLAMLAEIMEPMNDAAMAQSKFRCPYRNKDDLCTAKFGCRNQRKPKVKDLFSCAQKDNDNLDYRNFWEMLGE